MASKQEDNHLRLVLRIWKLLLSWKYVKVFELKVYILSCLFTSPVARFLSDFLWFEKKRNACPALGLNPGPLAYEASVLTILPRPLHSKFTKSWEVISIFVYFAGSQKLLEIKYPFFCFKYFRISIVLWKLKKDNYNFVILRKKVEIKDRKIK